MKLEEGKFYFEYNRSGVDIDLVYIYKIITSIDNQKYATIYAGNSMFRSTISLDIFNLSNELGYTFTEMKSTEDIINLVKTMKIAGSEGDRFIEFYETINKYKKTNNFKAQLGSL